MGADEEIVDETGNDGDLQIAAPLVPCRFGIAGTTDEMAHDAVPGVGERVGIDWRCREAVLGRIVNDHDGIAVGIVTDSGMQNRSQRHNRHQRDERACNDGAQPVPKTPGHARCRTG